MTQAQALAFEPDAQAQRRPGASFAASGVKSLDLQLVTTREAFDALEPEWNTLFACSADASRLFLGFNWNWHWCNHYLGKDGSTLAVITARHEGQLVMVWPLVQQRSSGLRIISFMGAPVTQYGDVLIDRNGPDHRAWLKQGWDYVLATLRPNIVLLRKVREDAAIADVMRQIGAADVNPQRAPYIDLKGTPDFETFELSYASKDRKNRRRKRKRMEETGTVGFRMVTGATEMAASIRQAMQQKRSWLDRQQLVSTALADERFDAFFSSAATSSERPAGCEIFEFTLDGRAIATKITVTDGTHRGLHFTAYDKATEKHSPGSLMFEEMIAAAIAGGITNFDFLAPAAPYKLEWAGTTVAVADYAVPVGMVGRLYQDVYLRRIRPRLQQIAKTGPAPVRRLMSEAVRFLGRRA